jgi:hypothetical protein
MTIEEIVNYLLLLVVLSIGMVRFKKLTVPFKILAFSVAATFLLDSLAKIFGVLYKTNAPILHLECLILFIFYSSVYYYLFQSRTIKKIVFFFAMAVFVFAIVNALFLQPFHKVFPSYLYLLTNTMMVILSLLLFKQMLLYPLKINITSQSVFWYNTSILFFSTTMFLNLGFINYYAKLKLGDEIIYYFWYGNYYILSVLTGVALLIDNQEKIEAYT